MKYFMYGLIVSLLLSLSQDNVILAQERPPVLAFYYAWFDQNSWSQSVDLPTELYTSADRATIERHVAQAQGAGIEAFVQSWYGPQTENNQTETNFRQLLEVAQATGFKAAVDFETQSPFYGSEQSVIDGLASLLTTHVNHPAYFRYQGKPVIFFWRQQRFSAARWQAIRAQLDPDHNTLWIAEGTDLSYQAAFDGHHLYTIAWAGSPANELTKWGQRVRDYGNNRLWVATTMPGYNDTKLPRANAFSVNRAGGDYYRQTWQGAIASQPAMILINSFNEWPEGTHIEPSQSYGNLYLDLTREWVNALQSGAIPAAITSVQAAAVETVATPIGPYIQAANTVNIRSAPSLTASIVETLAANRPTLVTGRTDDWWQIETGWVSNSVVTFVGDRTNVPVIESAITPLPVTPTVTITPTETPLPTPTPTETITPTPTDTATPTATTTPTITPTPKPVVVGEATTLDAVNVRAEPAEASARLGGVYGGEVVMVVSQSVDGVWWQILFTDSPNGLGWIKASFAEFEGQTPTIPVVGAEATAQSNETMTPTVVMSPTLPSVETPELTPTADTLTQTTTTQLIHLAALPTYAPTATSVHQATSAALLTNHPAATPSPRPAVSLPEDSWQSWPWGILSGLVLGGLVWYRWRRANVIK